MTVGRGNSGKLGRQRLFEEIAASLQSSFYFLKDPIPSSRSVQKDPKPSSLSAQKDPKPSSLSAQKDPKPSSRSVQYENLHHAVIPAKAGI